MNSLARITFLGLFQEFDVKEKSSAKYRVWNYNKTPCDVLGILLNRLGYEHVNNTDGAVDDRLMTILNLRSTDISRIYHEIDRVSSTNETIKRLVENLFKEFPIYETTTNSP